MAYEITYWKPAARQRWSDDVDEIRTVRIKRVAEIPALIKSRPLNCSLITQRRSNPHVLKNGRETYFDKEIWRAGDSY